MQRVCYFRVLHDRPLNSMSACIWLRHDGFPLLTFHTDVLFWLRAQKSYETKQYKKGLKAADSILKKFPDHGGQKDSI
jgi:hypothetical protein